MSGSIPASHFVDVVPGVLSAGGTALDFSGLVLTTNTRVPIGTVSSFPSAAAVRTFFGQTAAEGNVADVYFAGFDNSNVKPGALKFSQYPTANVGAYLRGGNISALTLAQLQAISGVLTITIDGTPTTSSSINLSAATSFSNAAQLITNGLALVGPTQASVTASFGATFTGSGSTTNLTASAVTGVIHIGSTITGTGVPANTTIVSQTSGTTGGAGVYVTNNSTTSSGASLVSSSTTMDVTAVGSGTLAIGQEVTGTSVTAGTYITALGTGTGGTGTYITTKSQQVVSEAMVLVMPTVTYDTVSGGFVIISATTGASSTITFGSGTISAAIAATQATGAVLSQGAVTATPAGAMAAIIDETQDWVTFTTMFNPSDADKVLFAQWVNSTGNQYAYAMWDTNIVPTEGSDTSSAGYQIDQADYSGTIPIYQPTDLYGGAFVLGAIASIDFTETNGRTNLAYRAQAGLSAGVTSETAAANLEADGYNYYGAVATRNDKFKFFYPGQISGPFKWIDTYVNQIWLNNQLQLAIIVGLQAVKSIPYNPTGDALMQSWCMDPINQGVNFGAIVPNVVLSAAQIAEVNSAAGVKIDGILSSRGWYLQTKAAQTLPQVRDARGSPPATLWYMDGGSINKISLASIVVQ